VSEAILEARGLTKRLGRRAVLADLDLSLSSGELVALLGENGAGKTTLLRCLAGIAQPTAGHVVSQASPDRRRARRAVGYVGHETLLYAELTARENLIFTCRLYGDANPERVDQLLRELALDRVAGHRVETFSRGMRQRLALARALVHQPQVLLLDEPWSALDPGSAANLDERLREFRNRGGAALFSSHDLERCAALADRAVLLRAGRAEVAAPPPLRADALARALVSGCAA